MKPTEEEYERECKAALRAANKRRQEALQQIKDLTDEVCDLSDSITEMNDAIELLKATGLAATSSARTPSKVD